MMYEIKNPARNEMMSAQLIHMFPALKQNLGSYRSKNCR